MAVDYSKLFENTIYKPSYTQKELDYMEDPVFGRTKVPDGFKFIQDQNGNGLLWPQDLVLNSQIEKPKEQQNMEMTKAPKEDNGEINKEVKSNNFTTIQGPENFNKLLDEVSNEKGFEDLKDPEMKSLILLQAKRESNFKQKAKSSSSTASGYFQFIDSTRKLYSNYDKESFLNDPKEQVRAATKYLRHILSTTEAEKLFQNGYNKAQIAALGWWYPKSMRMVLDGKKNFSLGGYSIERALKDYG